MAGTRTTWCRRWWCTGSWPVDHDGEVIRGRWFGRRRRFFSVLAGAPTWRLLAWLLVGATALLAAASTALRPPAASKAGARANATERGRTNARGTEADGPAGREDGGRTKPARNAFRSGAYAMHTLVGRYKRDMDERTMDRDERARRPTQRFGSCAVVGNSGRLLEHAHGAAIDQHDAVFRLNNAPAGGPWLSHVGNKTTVAVLNGHKLHHCANDTVFLHAYHLQNGEAGVFARPATTATTTRPSRLPTLRYGSFAQRQLMEAAPATGSELPPGTAPACERCFTYGATVSVFASAWEPYHFDDFAKCRLYAHNRATRDRVGQRYGNAPPGPLHGTLMKADRDLMRLADGIVARAFVDAARKAGRTARRALKLSHSTGLLAVLLSLGICNSVSLFGFDRRGGSANSSDVKQHHYYEAFTPHEYADHEFDVERDWFADLADGATAEASWLAERFPVPPVRLV